LLLKLAIATFQCELPMLPSFWMWLAMVLPWNDIHRRSSASVLYS
jgi:hypothetical protein